MKLKYKEPEKIHLVPKPLYCAGIKKPVIMLDGTWKLKHTKEPEKYINNNRWDDWEDIPVPSDIHAHLGSPKIFQGKYVYQRKIMLEKENVPCEYILRFEGVNGFTRVYIDGQPAAYHENAFLSWNADVTHLLRGKEEFILTVCVDEEADQVSAFNHGGILHSVMLYVMPKNYITSIRTTTSFEDEYQDGICKLQFSVKEVNTAYHYQAALLAPDACEVILLELEHSGQNDQYLNAMLKVPSVYSWDAEHPWLYTLKLSVWEGKNRLEEIEHRFGFRQIERIENQLYVNGREVKLRGVCRHEISPRNGRCLTKELIEQDVALFKEANCNYIRTSHYPPSEYFLQQCDEKGIYVEDELALAFIARSLPYTQRDPQETERYLSHFTEMVARDYSHPCVLIWSLCNESFGGYNFDLLNRYAHRIDPTRPTKFSYPMTMREEHEPVDIWSIHYSNLEEDLAKKCDNVSVGYTPGYDRPVLHDEYAHIPCYNRTEHRRDPNVRNFWGESIKKFWDKIWNTKGALGGAIWAGIDETDIFTGGNTCLEWGIIDVWRRKKPEFYMTRKAYSPIVISKQQVKQHGNILTVEIENRFCHTNLSEIKVNWEYGQTFGSILGPKAEPRETANLDIIFLKEALLPDTKLKLEFYDSCDNKVDEYLLPVTGFCPVGTKEAGEGRLYPLVSEQYPDHYTVLGRNFHIIFNKETGLIREAALEGQPIIIGGPYLNVPYLRLGDWRKKAVSAENHKEGIKVTVSGSYGESMEVTFTITIYTDGRIDTEYRIDKMKVMLPKQIKLRVGVDCGGLDELGIYYLTPPSMDCLHWKRKGLWSIYPEDHIARCEGIATRQSKGSSFGERPDIPWSQEMKSYILNGRYDVDYKGTNDFRSLKEHIYAAELYSKGKPACLQAISDGSHSVRLEIEEPKELIISDRDERITYHGSWYPMEDYSGSLQHTEMWSKEAGAYAECTFCGTGVVWYGPVDTIYGIANVYLDGALVAADINQRVNGVDFPGSAAGYDKKYGFPLYFVSGLCDKEHTLRIEVTRTKAEDSEDCYIVLDYLRILKKVGEEPVRFIINNDYNYPHIAWGNYTKPQVLLQEGYRNKASVRLTRLN